MPAGRYWDLQLVQNYLYPRATFGEEPMATRLKAKEDELIRIFNEKDINVVVVGGEANGYWRIMGAKLPRDDLGRRLAMSGNPDDGFAPDPAWATRTPAIVPALNSLGGARPARIRTTPSSLWCRFRLVKCHRYRGTAGCSRGILGPRPADSDRKPRWCGRHDRTQAGDRCTRRRLPAHVGRRIGHVCDAEASVQSRFRSGGPADARCPHNDRSWCAGRQRTRSVNTIDELVAYARANPWQIELRFLDRHRPAFRR